MTRRRRTAPRHGHPTLDAADRATLNGLLERVFTARPADGSLNPPGPVGDVPVHGRGASAANREDPAPRGTSEAGVRV
ncbi:hypothetical protein AT728_20165 [Streptomyces silvensis]|uniref:Uncharacterized protein n=1 Tax=Streptomyces silvensis TaxID=1765722 RepID=A0A0W7X596_9ACTN|nr:hypothetical protein AT728_20165 [Streptomyces silvensis]